MILKNIKVLFSKFEYVVKHIPAFVYLAVTELREQDLFILYK